MASYSYKIIGAAVAAYLVAQQTECPPAIVGVSVAAAAAAAAPGVAAAGTAGLTALGFILEPNDPAKVKRQTQTNPAKPGVAPPGVPQVEFDRCNNDLRGLTINVKGPVKNNGIQVDGLPPSCMNLASVLDGDAISGPIPIPCGSACLLYDNLSREDYEALRVIVADLQAPK